MSDELTSKPDKRSLALRVLLMILMTLAFHLSATVLAALAVVQIVLALIGGGPNERLTRFGHSMGVYLRQLADFLSFASEEAPFPFSDWPSTD